MAEGAETEVGVATRPTEEGAEEEEEGIGIGEGVTVV